MSWFLPFFFVFSLVDSPQIFTLLVKSKAIFQGKKGCFGPKNIFLYQMTSFPGDKANSN